MKMKQGVICFTIVSTWPKIIDLQHNVLC